MTREISIAHLMDSSGVRFGTSGARGLVDAMTDKVCAAYTASFLQALEQRGEISKGTEVLIAGDLRSSTGRILRAVAYAIELRGHVVHHAGRIPSPAVALEGLSRGVPSIMVTGSHIPDDRNGIKFNTTTGEISKADEEAIRSQVVVLPNEFDDLGQLHAVNSPVLDAPQLAIGTRYVNRWLDAFPPALLDGRHVVVYGHSAVGRELLVQVMRGLGARVTPVGWSERFLPVDTEAIRPEDSALAQTWAAELSPWAIVSTDGDSDRPLLATATGAWLRGDVLGVLAARYLRADVAVTPVSCSTVVERCGAFQSVVRTRIGSPFVIEAMNQAVKAGAKRVVGYEANGGVLQATPLPIARGEELAPLPTRDALVGILSVMAAAVDAGVSLHELADTLPPRFTASGRQQNFPTDLTQHHLRRLEEGGLAAFQALLGSDFAEVVSIDGTDGQRATLRNGEIVHLRGSGNAPELRCYAEADSETRAQHLAQCVLGRAASTWT